MPIFFQTYSPGGATIGSPICTGTLLQCTFSSYNFLRPLAQGLQAKILQAKLILSLLSFYFALLILSQAASSYESSGFSGSLLSLFCLWFTVRAYVIAENKLMIMMKCRPQNFQQISKNTTGGVNFCTDTPRVYKAQDMLLHVIIMMEFTL